MSGVITIALFLALTWATFTMTLATNQGSSSTPHDTQISTGQFRLVAQPRGFALEFVRNGTTTQVPIPRDWLIPPQEEKEEEDNYVTSFQYDKEVSSFPIGNGQTGLRLSSYTIQKEGSAQAAAGRDVFLIFDPASSVVFRGGIERGITKERVRSQGCFEAKAEDYFVGDVNGDGLIDIGVVKEELECKQSNKRQDVDLIVGPFYKQEPVAWYIFRENAWKLEPSFSGKFPEHYQELPLIGIDRSPVDYVGCTLWNTCDRTKWPTNEN
jgi:hypothetical protein